MTKCTMHVAHKTSEMLMKFWSETSTKLGRSRRTWEVILEGALHKRVWECELCSCIEQIERLAVVNTATNICIQCSAGHFLTSWATVSFSTRTVFLRDTTIWSATPTLRFHWQADLRNVDKTTADQARSGQTRPHQTLRRSDAVCIILPALLLLIIRCKSQQNLI